MSVDQYLKERVEDQISYFDRSAIKNQKYYRWIKRAAIVCNILTTMTIAAAFIVPEKWKVYAGILAFVSSSLVLATYQWEEFENYGAKWEKFRLVAEQLRSEKLMYLNRAGRYRSTEEQERDCDREFVENVESIIRGTDISYFSLMVEPGRRIEKRLEGRTDSSKDSLGSLSRRDC